MFKVEEGYMPYLEYQTYYRMVGDPSNPTILLLHGGPGSSHQYFEVLDDLAKEGICLVMYDQLGCGKSYLDGHPELWHMTTWVNELIALRSFLKLKKVHLLGQSFGGMLALEYVLHYASKGVESLILSSTLSSASLWAKEQHRWINYLPSAKQAAIYQAEKTNNFTSDEYQQANAYFMQLHAFSPNNNFPCLQKEVKKGKESYQVAWGPNEYVPNGTLAHFEVTAELNKLKIPSLIISGSDDLCSPLVAKTMFDALPLAKWELVADARHMVFVDQNAIYKKILRKWLKEDYQHFKDKEVNWL